MVDSFLENLHQPAIILSFVNSLEKWLPPPLVLILHEIKSGLGLLTMVTPEASKMLGT